MTFTNKMERIVEAKMTTPELIALHGYRTESHTIFTSDGYMLKVHRVIPLLGFQSEQSKVALLHHGLLGSSDDWLLLGPGKALPYLLSDIGYDVWLANARGNKYSNAHTTHTPDNEEFWDFSWHEIGIYDLPAAIDYIRKITGDNSKLNLIGHSMGTTAIIALLSLSSKYNHKLRSVTLLAPLVFMYHTKGPLKDLADYFDSYYYRTESFIKEPEFMKNATFSREVIDKFCRGDANICLNPLLLLVNGGQDLPNPETTEKVLGHVPAGGSTKTIMHFCQLIKSGQFQLFDYGENLNYKTYGTRKVPAYNLNHISVPVVLFSSPDDWLSDVHDVLTLLSQLRNPILHHVLTREEFSHSDFVWSEDASELIYYLLIDILEQPVLQKDMVNIK
ncbi:hypothetical protein K1T71_000191 [Dendrolimus kikuchii]|uniref:Uncharacterized protein n=1 Tax=Dendrolimus kikuchii TaxID=765133 RepID=A0ACC1DIG3_9NEOP|nr:hypothetical protein K1T71_000191 [Dendrolimus kikuchii]